jgi:hypothetical protein
LIQTIITKDIPLPNTFNVKNSPLLMEKLSQIPYTDNLRLASFDIKDMYTNIPTHKLPNILKMLCSYHGMPYSFTQELITLMRILLKQNYFNLLNTKFLQTSGLAMGAPTSSIFSELFLQFMEHTALYDILTQNQVLGYFRYVDDILLVYDAPSTNIDTVLNQFNTATSPLQFIIEPERQINFLHLTIFRDTHQLSYGIYRKATTTDSIIPFTSCHPQDHKHSAIRYFCNRLITYPLHEQHKIQEEQIINHILRPNSYPPPQHLFQVSSPPTATGTRP